MADQPPVPQTRYAASTLGLPEEVLDVVLGYSDLRTRNLAVTTSKAFCASYARLSPTLDYQLVFKRFPLAEASTRGVAERPAAPKLFKQYQRYFGRDPDTDTLPKPEPTVPLDSYTLAVELELINTATNESETFFVGTGTVEIQDNKPKYNFPVPAGVYYTAGDRCDRDGWDRWNIRAKVVATRRFNGRLQHAKLYCGTIEEGDMEILIFNYQDLPNYRSEALRWYGHLTDITPGLNVIWKREPDPQDDPAPWNSHSSALKVNFTWGWENIVDQPLDDTCLTLEHYLHWE